MFAGAPMRSDEAVAHGSNPVGSIAIAQDSMAVSVPDPRRVCVRRLEDAPVQSPHPREKWDQQSPAAIFSKLLIDSALIRHRVELRRAGRPAPEAADRSDPERTAPIDVEAECAVTEPFVLVTTQLVAPNCAEYSI